MRTRARLASLVPLSAALLGGCVSSGQSTLSVMRPQQLYIFRGLKTVDRDYIDRYACPDRRPLMCTCTSPHSESCDCSC
jgi:hypothetical protein